MVQLRYEARCASTQPGQGLSWEPPGGTLWMSALMFAVGLAFVTAVALTWLGEGRIPYHELVIAAGWSVFCLVCMRAAHRTGFKALWFNLAALTIIFAVAEFWTAKSRQGAESSEARLEFSNGARFFVDDEELGYRPAKGYSGDVRFYFADELIFDVRYTVDDFGLRATPRGDAGSRCVLFFGGSYTFGAGVSDEETMPYLVDQTLAPRFEVRNFGFSGYGPHQMLAALETGLVDRAAECDARYAVYLAQPHHVLRSAGKFRSDPNGPRYVLDGGTVVRVGNFDDVRLTKALRKSVERSALVNRLLDRREASDDDLALFHSIVMRSAELLRARYPGLEFHVLYWDNGIPELFEGPYASAMDDHGIVVHRISEVLPLRDRETMETTFQIPFDGHPNAQAHRVLAEHVVNTIVR